MDKAASSCRDVEMFRWPKPALALIGLCRHACEILRNGAMGFWTGVKNMSCWTVASNAWRHDCGEAVLMEFGL